MKILYFSDIKLPSQNAQSVHAIKMAQAFAHAGHDVTLFARGVPGGTPEEIFQAYNIQDSFKLELYSSFGIPFLADAVRWMDLSGKARKVEYADLVCGADPVALAYLCPTGAKMIIEAHELPEQKSKIAALKKVLKNDNFKGLVVSSDMLKQDFLTAYPELKPENVFVAYDGANLIDRMKEIKSASVWLKGNKEAFKVGYVGSLHPGKGVGFIGRLARLRPAYEFHVVGGIERHIQKYQDEYLSANLHFYGHRDHADIPAFLESFDVLLAPYQNLTQVKTGRNAMRWLSPIKIFEYMAANKPMICSDLPILHEILTHDHNALLLPAAEEKLWARGLDKLKNNSELAMRLAANAYADLADKFTWDKRAAALLDLAIEKPEIFRLSRISA